MAKPKKAKKKLGFRSRIETTLKTIKSDTFNLGFTKLNMWVSTGNFAMNRYMSGRFDTGLMFGRNYIYYGESGSAKSLMSAYVAANAQKEHGALVVWIDVEKATDDEAGQKWLARAGVDPENLVYASAATLEDIQKVFSSICGDYKKATHINNDPETKDEDKIELQPVVFIVDSWSAALTAGQWDQATKGEMKGDQGQKAKQTGDLILKVTHLVAGLPILVIGIAHIMDNQDGYGRRHKTTGGNKMIYMASGCLLLTKKDLTADDVDNKDVKKGVTDLAKGLNAEMKKQVALDKKKVGITCQMEILKSRVSKPFERVDIQIPWMTGMDPYTGLFDVLSFEGMIKNTSPGWYGYTDPENGDVKEKHIIKFRQADFKDHANRIMALADQDCSSANAIISTAGIVALEEEGLVDEDEMIEPEMD